MSAAVLSLSHYFSLTFPLLACTAAYTFYVCATLALTRSSLSEIEELAAVKGWCSELAHSILNRSAEYLLCAQAGRFLSAVAAGVALSKIGLVSANHSEPQRFATDVIFLILYAVIALVSVQISKSVTLHFPETTLRVIAIPLRVTFLLCGPLVVVVHSIVSAALRAVKLEGVHERDMSASSEDLSEFIRTSSQVGAMERVEQDIIEGVVDLPDSIVREVMTPRTDIVFMHDTASTNEIASTFLSRGISRLLVTGKEIDDVKGIVLARDLLKFVGVSVSPDAWKSLIRPVQFVPNTKHLDELLTEMRAERIHFAVVVDEHGSVDGIITMEDLFEEIVGDIFDESDQQSVTNDVIDLGNGMFAVDGAIPTEEVPTRLGITIPEGEYDTLAGFLLAKLGHLPAHGETIVTESAIFTILEVQQNRVVKVSVQQTPATLEKLLDKTYDSAENPSSELKSPPNLRDDTTKPTVSSSGSSSSRISQAS